MLGNLGNPLLGLHPLGTAAMQVVAESALLEPGGSSHLWAAGTSLQSINEPIFGRQSISQPAPHPSQPGTEL